MRSILSKLRGPHSKIKWRTFFKMASLWMLLNFLLFTCNLILNVEVNHVLPFRGALEEYTWHGFLFFNNNHHPFRLSGDWVVLSLIAALLTGQINRKWLHWGSSIIYFILFAYSVYYGIYYFIYGAHPYFISNALLISNVFPIFLGTLGIPSWLFFLLAMIICSLIFYALWSLQLLFLKHLEQSQSLLKIPMITGCILYLVIGHALYLTSEHKKDDRNIRWWSTYILQSSQSISTFDWDLKSDKFNRLASLCNTINRDSIDLYLLVIESYGAVATEAPAVANKFRPFLDSADYSLDKNGWTMASGYSIAPIKGGRSWLSFSTIMTGNNIDNQYAYEHFLSHGKNYPHLFNCLRKNGFHTTWMNTMRPPKKSGLGIQDSLLRNVWRCDEWIQYSDLKYSGRRFDPYGGIPDQYALNVYRESRSSNTEQPHFLFFINTGSHSPWYAPPPIVDDHKDLDQTKGGHKRGYELSSFTNYEQSMRYQIEYITQYIRKWGDNDDLFVLIGDHQPPAMEYILEDIIHQAAVPYHVISKNEDLLNAFYDRGANPGLNPMRKDSIFMRHEELYETILKSLQ